MSLLYTLGWPGMVDLPCVIVDHVSKEVFSPTHKLPLSKIHLNTTNNKYVELAAVLRKFPPGKDKDAMHSFMTISSDFGMRKFFMDRHQRAYISLDTLLVYVVVYPYCTEFIQARADVAKYLQTYREIPCLRCGFIHRDCRCNGRETEAEECDIIGFATEQIDREAQTEPIPILPQSTVLQTTCVPVGTATPQVQKPPLQSLLINNQITSDAATSVVNPTPSKTMPLIKEKPANKSPPINIVTPMISKPLMIDAACQTRANFDFSMKKRDKNNWEKSKDISSEGGSKDGRTTPGIEQQSASLLQVNLSGTSTAPLPPSPMVNLVPSKQPVKISLWKLLDSDTSDDDEDNSKKKNEIKSKPSPEKVTDVEKEKYAAPLPKLLDFTGETKETNTTEKLSEEEKLLLQEAEKLAPEESNLIETDKVDTGVTEVGKEVCNADNKDDSPSKLECTDEKTIEKLDNNSVDNLESKTIENNNVVSIISDKKSSAEKVEIEKVDSVDTVTENVSPEDIESIPEKSESSTSKKPDAVDTSVEISMFEALDNEKKNEKTIEENETNIIADNKNSSESVNDNGDSALGTADNFESVSVDESAKTSMNSSDTTMQQSVSPQNVSSSKDESFDVPMDDKFSKLESRMTGIIEKVTKAVVREAELKKGLGITEKMDSVQGKMNIDNEPMVTEQSEAKIDQPALDRFYDTAFRCVGKGRTKAQAAMETLDFLHKQTVITTSKEGYNSTDLFNDKKMTKHLHKSGDDLGEGVSSGDVSKKPALTEEIIHIKGSADAAEDKNWEKDEKYLKEGDKKENDVPKKVKEKMNVEKLVNFKKWCHRFEYTPTGEKIFRCTFTRCGQCFDTKKSAVVHNKVHGSFGRESMTDLQCYKCDYVTSLNKWFDMVRHLKFSHDELITSTEFGCFLCGRDFPDAESVNRHIDFHYSGRYKCVHCGNILFTWKQVEEHIKETCESKDKKEKNLGCPYCPLVFHIRNMRNAHMLSHQDKGLVCAFCESEDVWENWKLLRKHYQQKHGDKIRSSMNPLKKMNLNRPALDPKTTPALKPSFKCEIKKNPICHVCDAEFIVIEDFEYHMRKKHDFIPYVLTVCETCEKTFKTMKMYEWHMRNTHGDDIKCDQCEFVAKTQLMLKVHQQNKHVLKEHVCSECNKEFEHYHQLRMHMARHALHTIYCCQVCGEEFKRQKELRQHVNIVHPKNDSQPNQSCPDCDYTCFTKRAMEAHIKKYHPRLAEEIEDSENAQPISSFGSEHSYYSRTPSADGDFSLPVPPRPPPPPKPPRPEPIAGTEEGGEEGRLVIRLPKNISKKYNKNKKSKKRRLSSISNDEPKELSEEFLEKQRIRRDRKENLERLKILSRETSARTRTYEDFVVMKQLIKPKVLQQQSSSQDVDVEEPDTKRPRVSKYGRSITTKQLDDIYVPSVKFYNGNETVKESSEAAQFKIEKQKRAEAIKRQRISCGLYGVAPPETWEDEDIAVDYPYIDHCYFTIEHAETIPNQQPASTSAASVTQKRYSDSYVFGDGEPPVILGAPGGSKAISLGDLDFVGTPGVTGYEEIAGQEMQTFRIGPGGFVKKPSKHSRKQKIQYRDGIDMSSPERVTTVQGGFMPLSPSLSQHLTVQVDNTVGDIQQPQYIQQTNQDIQEEIIEQELMREVTEIAQKDPVLQDLIYSMQQTAGQGASMIVPPSPQGTVLLNNPISNTPQQEIVSRNVTPPRSLDISLGLSQRIVRDTDMSSKANQEGYAQSASTISSATPTKLQLTAAHTIQTGLTPTKQSMLDFVLSKNNGNNGTELEDIDLNEDELKQLLNEHNRSIEQAHGDGSSSQDSTDLANDSNIVTSLEGGESLSVPNQQISIEQTSVNMVEVDEEEQTQETLLNENREKNQVLISQPSYQDEVLDSQFVSNSEVIAVDSMYEKVDVVGKQQMLNQAIEGSITVGTGLGIDDGNNDNIEVTSMETQNTVPITLPQHLHTVSNDSKSELNSSSGAQNRKKVYRVVYKQPDGRSVIRTVIGDKTNVRIPPHVPTSSPQTTGQITDFQTSVVDEVGEDIAPDISVLSYNENNVTQNQEVVLQPQSEEILTEEGEDSTGISALIAASQIREQEQNTASLTELPQHEEMDSGEQYIQQPHQIQYVNEQGELISVEVADPESKVPEIEELQVDTNYEVQQIHEGFGVQRNISQSSPQASQIVKNEDGSLIVMSGNSSHMSRTEEVFSNPSHTIVKQVLQEPATVPVISHQSQYKTVSLPGKASSQTSLASSLTAVQVMRGKGGQTSLLTGQPRQSLIIRQPPPPPPHQQPNMGRTVHIQQLRGTTPRQIFRGRGAKASGSQLHRVVRMSSPNQIIQNQNQTKVIKLPSAAGSLQSRAHQQQQQGIGRIVSVAGAPATSNISQRQGFVRVVQRPVLQRGRGGASLVRPRGVLGNTARQHFVTRASGPAPRGSHLLRLRNPATSTSAGASGVRVVRLESDGKGGQRMVHVEEQYPQ